MNKLTYRIISAKWMNSEFTEDCILYTTLWMNGKVIMSDHNYYSTKWAAKRGINRISKLLASNVKVVDISVN